MRRRLFLTGALGAAGTALMGHSPYRRWYQYRARHALVVADREDARAFPLAERLARYLAAARPDLGAAASRAQNVSTVVSLLKSGQVELALLRGEDAYQALHGLGADTGGATPVRALASLAPEYLYLVAPETSTIAAIGDLRGSRVAVVEDGGRAGLKARRLAAAVGLDGDGTLRWEPVGPDDVLAALGKGRFAACWLEAPLPAPLLDPDRRPAGLRLRLVAHGDAIPLLAARYGPVYFRARLSSDRYPGIEISGEVLAEARLLACREDLPPARARVLVEALAGWDGLAPPGTALPIPLHAAVDPSRRPA